MITTDKEVQRLVREELDREEAGRMERIRQTVLERQAREQAAQEREARIAQLRERIPVELDQAPLEAARAALRTALVEYMRVCRAHDQRFSDLWMEISNLAGSGPLPKDMAAAYGTISMGGVDYRRSRAQTTLVNLARDTFREQYPRDGFDLGRPQD